MTRKIQPTTKDLIKMVQNADTKTKETMDWLNAIATKVLAKV